MSVTVSVLVPPGPPPPPPTIVLRFSPADAKIKRDYDKLESEVYEQRAEAHRLRAALGKAEEEVKRRKREAEMQRDLRRERERALTLLREEADAIKVDLEARLETVERKLHAGQRTFDKAAAQVEKAKEALKSVKAVEGAKVREQLKDAETRAAAAEAKAKAESERAVLNAQQIETANHNKRAEKVAKEAAERVARAAEAKANVALKLKDAAEAAKATAEAAKVVLQNKTKELAISLADARTQAAELERGQQELTRTLAAKERRLEVLSPGEMRGRPRGVKGWAALDEAWTSMSRAARGMALGRHNLEVYNKLESIGVDDFMPESLAVALETHGILALLWETRPLIKMKMAFAHDLRKILAAEWGVQLAIYFKNDVGLSDRDYDKARLALSKVHTNGAWKPRVWYVEPTTGEKLHLPEPLVSRYKWFAPYKEYAAKYGLLLSEDGKVSSRGFKDTLIAMLRRDAASLKVPTIDRPWHPCFGIDHTSVSSRRDFTHAGITLGGLTKEAKHFSSELKLMTLAVGQHHDNAAGISAIIGGDAPSPIASEISDVAEAGTLDLHGGITLTDDDGADVELTCPPCEPVICLDLAAARSMRQCRGKTACVCNCTGKEGLQGCPGVNGRAEIPADATWEEAEKLLAVDCGYDTDIMSYPSLRMACHDVPDEFDWAKGGWRCTHKGCGGKVVYPTRESYVAAKAAHEALVLEAAKNKEKAKELTAKLKDHAEGHLDAILFAKIPIRIGTNRYIIDPMHALELNVGKVAWKWAFTNQMNADSRDTVSTFLDTINLPIDLREKGKRERQMKWFSASGFDEFVLGKERSRPPHTHPGVCPRTRPGTWVLFKYPTCHRHYPHRPPPHT